MDFTDSDATYCEEIENQKNVQKIEIMKNKPKRSEVLKLPSTSQRLTRSQQKQNNKQSQESSVDVIPSSQPTNNRKKRLNSKQSGSKQVVSQQDHKAILAECRKKLNEIKARIKKKDITNQESQLFEKELADIKKKVSDKRTRNSVDSTYLKLCELSEAELELQEVPVENEGTKKGVKRPSNQEVSTSNKRKRKKITESIDNSDGLVNVNLDEWDGISDAHDLNQSLVLVTDDDFQIYQKQHEEELKRIQEIVINAKAFIDKCSQEDHCISDPPIANIKTAIDQPSTSQENVSAPVTNTKSESLFSYIPDNLKNLPSNNSSSFGESGFFLAQKCEPSLMEYDDINFRSIKDSTPSHTPFLERSGNMHFFDASFNPTRNEVTEPEAFFEQYSENENQQQPEDYSYEEIKEPAPVGMQTNIKEENKFPLPFFNELHLRLLADRLNLSENFLRICILETFRKASAFQENKSGEVSEVPLQNESAMESDLESEIPCSLSTMQQIMHKRSNRMPKYTNYEINHPVCVENILNSY